MHARAAAAGRGIRRGLAIGALSPQNRPRRRRRTRFEARGTRQAYPQGTSLNFRQSRVNVQSSVYTVDRAYDQDASSDDIYADAVQHLVPWAWGGGIGTLFAYGQTGSGKTYTVSAIERMVARGLMDGGLEGDRKVFVSVTELAGNTAYGA